MGILQEIKMAQSLPEGTQILWGDFQGKKGYFECDFLQGVEYANIHGHSLHVDIIRPMMQQKFPLIVFVQGSAWRPQPIKIAYGKMFHMATKGYIVAMVEYRNTDIAQYPAPIEDTKTAIRFLKAHADEYGIDKERVAVWGDSSGGHVALMAGFLPPFEDRSLYPEESERVNAVVDFYGITDISRLGFGNDALDHDSADAPEALLLGAPVPECIERAKQASPLYNIPDEDTPPTMIVHGSDDGVVNVSQSVWLYEKMRELGKVVYFYKVMHADHGMGIWQEKVFDTIDEFLRCYLYHPSVEKPLFQHKQ